MSFKITGSIIEVKETRVVSEKFSVREFVIQDDSGQYPQKIQFQASQDRCDLLDKFKGGEVVNVSFNLRGREWINPQGESKYFNSLDAWKIEGVQFEGSIPPLAEPPMNTGSGSDLPF